MEVMKELWDSMGYEYLELTRQYHTLLAPLQCCIVQEIEGVVNSSLYRRRVQIN